MEFVIGKDYINKISKNVYKCTEITGNLISFTMKGYTIEWPIYDAALGWIEFPKKSKPRITYWK